MLGSRSGHRCLIGKLAQLEDMFLGQLCYIDLGHSLAGYDVCHVILLRVDEVVGGICTNEFASDGTHRVL